MTLEAWGMGERDTDAALATPDSSGAWPQGKPNKLAHQR